MERFQAKTESEPLKKAVESFRKNNPEIVTGDFEKDLKLLNDRIGQSEIDFENQMNQIAFKRKATAKVKEANKYSIYGNLIEFNFKDYQAKTPQQLKVLEKAEVIAERLKKSDFNVVMFGDVGSGKTSLALAIKSEIKNKATLFLNTPLFIEKIKDGYGRKPYEDVSKFNVALKKAIYNTDILILDDFASEANMTNSRKDGASQYLQEIMYEIAERRYGKTNIITTNIVTTDSVKGFDVIAEIYSEKIASRLITRDPDNVINFADIKDYRTSRL